MNLTRLLQLKEGEQVHAMARKHPVTLGWRLIMAAVLIITPFFFLFALTKLGKPGLVIFAFLEAAGIFIALRAILLWDANVFVVTSRRLVRVDQQGLWKRTMAEIPLGFVQEVLCERLGLSETLWRIGTLRVKTSSSPDIVGMVIKKISYPERLQGLINELREKKTSDRFSDLRTLLEQADEETIAAVRQMLNKQ